MNLSHFSALVADDHQVCRLIISEILRSVGMRDIREAVDGGEAYLRICDRPPDVLFLDMEMPHDGLSTLLRIRSSPHSHIREVPVIIATAYTSRDKILALRDAGATEVLTKPLTIAKLLGRTQSALFFPRPFIQSPSFTGPDRRRSVDADYRGPLRRASDGEWESDVVEIDVA